MADTVHVLKSGDEMCSWGVAVPSPMTEENVGLTECKWHALFTQAEELAGNLPWPALHP